MGTRTLLGAVLIVFLASSTAGARVWRVFPDGSGDAPTIQAAYNQADPPDTVLVGPGVYHEHAIESKADVVLLSRDGPLYTIIDAFGGGHGIQGKDFNTHGDIIGLTISGASEAGIAVIGGGTHTISDCVFQHCGAGLIAWSFEGTIRNVTAIASVGGPSTGSGFYFIHGAPNLLLSISAFNEGAGIRLEAGAAGIWMECCDVFGNHGGDFEGVEVPPETNGNFSADPRFCDLEQWNLQLDGSSRCAPGAPGNQGCGLIGALPVGCGRTPPRFPRIDYEPDGATPEDDGN